MGKSKNRKSFNPPLTTVFPLFLCALFLLLASLEYSRLRDTMSVIAASLPVLLADDFQDRASGPDSISRDEEMRNRRLMNGIKEKFRLKWVYTLVEEEGGYFFSAPSVSEEEARERDRWYYLPYENIPEAFDRAFREQRRTFSLYRDDWGRTFSVILPLISPGGRPYLSCVDISLGQLLKWGFLNRIIEFFLILIMGAAIEVYLILMKGKNEELSLIRHEVLTHKRELERVLYERNQEIKERAEKYARLNMRLLAALETSNLTLVIINLEDMSLRQETPFTYEGEEPEKIEGTISFEAFFLEFIHPSGHHLIKDTLHEFKYEGIDEKTLELRMFHEGRWLWFRFYCRRNSADSHEMVVLGQMIHQEKTRSEELYRKANYDALTHMVNRHYCYSYLEDALEQKRKRDFPMALAFIDADGLKIVNDTLGHKQGDRYLLDTVAIINRAIRDDDILGRIGGDEFLLICPQTSEEDFAVLVQRIDEEIEKFNAVSGLAYQISFSMGFVEVTGQEDKTVDELMEMADARMYENKSLKKQRGGGVSLRT